MTNLANFKHLFFDLDETVTPSRSIILPHMKALMSSLSTDIAIISGLTPDTIKKHVDGLHIITMGQNGNNAFDYDGTLLWNDILATQEKDAILKHISEIVSQNDFDLNDPTDIIEDRDSQISYSLIGHHEEVSKKKLSDPTLALRKRALTKHPLLDQSVEVRISGSTTLDYFRKGAHKGKNVRRLIDYKGWKPDECVYFGDRLHPGGNDEAVIGVIETVAVTNHEHTYELLKEAFGPRV
jgi:HAD superfamily hydrolase (TIGR01484 family)